jgi:hypothetical protein
MHPIISRDMMMARQQDELRAAAGRRLAAQAKKTRTSGNPTFDDNVTATVVPVAPAARVGRVPQLRRLLARLLPA